MNDAEAIKSPSVGPAEADVRNQKAQTVALWQHIVLGVILLLSAFLSFFNLGLNHYGPITTSVNSYYAAAVKSMALNWHNFFFAAFDPQGFLAIDKPPLGFWFQVLSIRLFGFSEWSLLLPEALAGVGAVAVLYLLIRRIFGVNTGLLAALTLALTPISVVTSRNNTIDSILVLTLLFAAWALSLAAETGRLRWLLLSMLLVGLGFNIKMLEAYLVLPAFALTYLLSAPRPLRVRILHLVLACLVLCVVSFSWITIVDLVPPSLRPYVSSTQHDSELELALGYNGLSRVFGIGGASAPGDADTGTATTVNTTTVLVVFGIVNTGAPGPLRLIGSLLGGQIGWLLLFALVGLVAACAAGRWKRPLLPLTSYQQGLIFWGTWFLTLLVFFSAAFFDHPYYLVTFAPAVSALVGIGGIALYRAYRARRGWKCWLLPLALLATALVQGSILLPFPVLNRVLGPVVLGISILLILVLCIGLLVPRFPRETLTRPFFSVALVALLLAPAAWSALPLLTGTDTVNPLAGPPPSLQSLNALILVAHALIPESAHAQPSLEHYLIAHQGEARYIVATFNASTAAPFILDTGRSVLAFGGYNGFDPILNAQSVASLVQQGQVRFFLLPLFQPIHLNKLSPALRQGLEALVPGQTGSTLEIQPQPILSDWVTTHCTLVPRSVVEPGISGASNTVSLGEGTTIPTQLFDCASAQG